MANEAAFLSALTVPLLTWTNVAFLVRPNKVQIRKGGRSGSSCYVKSLEMPALGTLVALAKKGWKSWKFDGELEILAWLPHTEKCNKLSILFSTIALYSCNIRTLPLPNVILFTPLIAGRFVAQITDYLSAIPKQ